MTRRPALVTQAEVERMIRAAKADGRTVTLIEIGKAGLNPDLAALRDRIAGTPWTRDDLLSLERQMQELAALVGLRFALHPALVSALLAQEAGQ